jgi:hypothetical protein
MCEISSHIIWREMTENRCVKFHHMSSGENFLMIDGRAGKGMESIPHPFMLLIILTKQRNWCKSTLCSVVDGGPWRRVNIPPYWPPCSAIISEYGGKSRNIGHDGDPKNYHRYPPWLIFDNTDILVIEIARIGKFSPFKCSIFALMLQETIQSKYECPF